MKNADRYQAELFPYKDSAVPEPPAHRVCGIFTREASMEFSPLHKTTADISNGSAELESLLETVPNNSS